MASASTERTRVLLDPWTAAVASAAAKRGDLSGGTAEEWDSRAEETRAPPTATANKTSPDKQQPPQAGHSIASKFNLPQANVLHVLRAAYFGAARNAHNPIAAVATSRPIPKPPPSSEASIADLGHPGEGREPKRLKAATGDDAAAASRRSAVALKRLCAALGVLTQQEHRPDHNLSYAVASCRGWRAAMEDTYAAEMPLYGEHGVSMFAVYDGHGGAEVARYSALHMGRAVREAPSATAAFASGHPTANPPASAGGGGTSTASASAPGPPPCGGCGGGANHHGALRDAFLSLDRQLADEGNARELMALANPGALTAPPEAYGRRTTDGPYLGPAAGSTASVALVGRSAVTVAAVGDSRCILGSRGGGVVALTVDHKGSDAAERERVLRAGCWVSSSGRVCGELDMSRALGDADMKQAAGLPPHLQAVTADPTVKHIRLEPTPPAKEMAAEGALAEAERTPQGGQDADAEAAGPRQQQQQQLERDCGRGGGGEGAGGGGSGGGGVLGPDSSARPSVGRGGSVQGTGRGGSGSGGGASSSGRKGSNGGGGSGVGTSTGGCYLLLASDGLWNVLDTDTVHQFVQERLDAGLPAESVCAQLCVEACVSERTAYDNVTVLIVQMFGVRPAGEVQVTMATPAVEAEAAADEDEGLEEEEEVVVGDMPQHGSTVGAGEAVTEALGEAEMAEVGAAGWEADMWGGCAEENRAGVPMTPAAPAPTGRHGEKEEDDEPDEGEARAGGNEDKEEEGEEAEEGAEAPARADEVQRLTGRLWSDFTASSHIKPAAAAAATGAVPHHQPPPRVSGSGYVEGLRRAASGPPLAVAEVCGSAAVAAMSSRCTGVWQQQQPLEPELHGHGEGEPENGEAAVGGPLSGDAMCHVWLPELFGGVAAPRRAVGRCHGMDVSHLAGIARGAVAGMNDERLLEPSPMQEDGPF